MPDTFTKSRPTAADSYPAEAAGLAWLAAAGPGSAQIVPVLAVSERRLILRRLTPVRPSRAAAIEFGTALAATHAAGAAAFGAPPDGWHTDGYIGTQPLSLQPTPSWGVFFADQRLLPYADAAVRVGGLSRAGRQLIGRLCQRLRAGDFDDGRPPARIHSDLWAGNVIYTESGVVLIDPAAHGGHGLTDLAMLHLFGAPELAAITESYAAAAQLPPNWPDLIGLHQLHPLLVHAVTHSPSYGLEAEAIAARYLR